MDNKVMAERKKRVAAIAAVTAYIKSQEEMMAAMAGAAVVETPQRPIAIPSMWGFSGRQDIMQYRSLMQMKAFHGARLKY
ncbi:Uncharacterized protein dnl_16490 [Desulfonema limicola]|uniref:Uncharacterized protein n=1 Tax=Desulfonema limicola TaxID=45656 RepID=A0A975B5V4_9BACT|nr:hypothetical protein [Desulfonema limicola]QTA79381.1 Uncharacterized protein dnl_16490 [Desulfonema limicola]